MSPVINTLQNYMLYNSNKDRTITGGKKNLTIDKRSVNENVTDHRNN